VAITENFTSHRPGRNAMIEISTPSESTVVCRPLGNLDVAGSLQFRHVIADLARTGLNLEIDLGYVDFIDAVGVSALVGCIRRVRAVGGEVALSNPHSQVQRLLDLLGVYRLVLCPSSTSDDHAA
jgi:anti-anti-sigma factor